MAEVLCVVLTFKTDLIGGTAAGYHTTGREYLGAGRPGAFRPDIQEFVNLQRDAFDDGASFGEIAASVAQLRISNPDGALDAYIGYGGGRAEFYLLASEYAAWSTKTLMIGLDIEFCENIEGTSVLQVRLKDGRALLDKPFEPNVYAGTNAGASGLEGLPEDLKDQRKVNALGYVFQAPVPWANAAAQIVHLDRIRIDDVADSHLYDGLVALTRSSVQTSIANLQASTPGVGEFALYRGTAGDGAYAKIGGNPAYTITADIDGQARGGTFRSLPGDLFEEVITQRAGKTVDAGDIAALNAAAPWDLGKWIDTEMSIREVCNIIARSVLGFWGEDRAGVYRIFQLVDPAGETPVAAFRPIFPTGAAKSTDGDIIAIERLTPADETAGLPAADISVLYAEFAQVTDLGFDTNAPLAFRQAAKKQWRTARPSSPLLDWRAKYPLAPPLTFETAIAFETHAIACADLAAALFSREGRARYRVTFRLTDAVISAIDLGAIVELTFPRWDLGAGKNGQILGMRYRSFGVGGVDQVLQCNVFV